MLISSCFLCDKLYLQPINSWAFCGEQCVIHTNLNERKAKLYNTICNNKPITGIKNVVIIVTWSQIKLQKAWGWVGETGSEARTDIKTAHFLECMLKPWINFQSYFRIVLIEELLQLLFKKELLTTRFHHILLTHELFRLLLSNSQKGSLHVFLYILCTCPRTTPLILLLHPLIYSKCEFLQNNMSFSLKLLKEPH